MIFSTYIKAEKPDRGTGIRLAIYQGRGQVGTKKAMTHNLNILEKKVKSAKQYDAQLISFSELYLSGYTLEKDVIPELSEEIDGPIMKMISNIARDNSIAILCPYPEKANVHGKTRYYDSMALFGNSGQLLKNYRKAHLWGPVEKDKFDFGYVYKEEGSAYSVHTVNDFPIGVANCYEAEFPELTRILALKGAKLVIIPTAADEWEWEVFPEKDKNGKFIEGTGKKTSKPYPDVSKNVIPVHAQENTIFVAYSNGYGTEMMNENAMMDFLGNSVIADPTGKVIIAARKEETLLIADCIPGDYDSIHPRQSAYLENRRPDLYSELVAIHGDNYLG